MKTITSLLSFLHHEEINIKDQVNKYICLYVTFYKKIESNSRDEREVTEVDAI